ncbi:MAG: sulfur oxidation c-type cytochrome SoxX [Gammaproteobacteria bacterium]
MNKPVNSLANRIRYDCRGILGLAFLAPVALPADEAGNPSPYFDWQVENYEINTLLGGLTGVAERGRVIAGDLLRGNCLACHRLPIPEEDFHGNPGPPLAGIASCQSMGMIHLHIVDQSRFNPETVMPGYYRPFGQLHRVAAEFRGRTYLSAQEVEDVVAYLSTLK